MPASSRVSRKGGWKMILYLEGNDHDREAAQALLQEHGFKVSLQSGGVPGAAACPDMAEEDLPLAFLEHSIDGIVILDVETVGVLYANNAFVEMLGYSLEELHGLKVWDLDAVYSREEIEEIYATRNWPGERFETRHRRKGGRLLDVDVSHKPIIWRGKEVIFCVVKDISERKRTERALLLTQVTVEKAGDCAHWLTHEGRFIYVNEATCAALGYSREELEGMSIGEVDPNYTREKYSKAWHKLKEKGSVRLESVHRAKDGRIYPVEIRCNYVNFDGKEYCCAFATDISERKQREEALRFTQYVVDKTVDQAFWVTPEGRIHYANEAACASLGYSRTELEGLGVWDINPTVFQEDFAKHWLPVKENGSLVFETVHQTKDGRLIPVEIRSNYVNFDGREYSCSFVTDLSERKQKEEALRFTQYVMDKTGDQALWVTPEGRIHYVNEAACTALGYSREELEGMALWEVDPHVNRENSADYWQQLKEKGSQCFESLHQTKDGRIYPAEIRSNYVNFDGQEFSCAFVTDISERKQAEQQLRQANLIVENSPVVVFHWGASDDWPVKMVSRNVTQFGYTPEELLSGELSYAALVHPEDLDQLEAELHVQIERGEDQFQHEYRIATKQGEMRWVDERTLIERDADGKVCGYQGIVVDITDRKEKEAALRLNQVAMDNTADQAFWLTPEGRITYVNNAACASLGYSSEELVGMSVSDIDPNVPPERLLETWKSLKAVKSRSFESSHIAKDGRIYPVEIRSSYVNFDGEEYRFAFANDISERKAAEEALRRSEERYRQLMEMLPIAAYSTDAEGRITFFNRKAKNLWQRTPRLNEDLWCGSYKIYHPDGRPMPHDSCPMALTLKTGEVCQGREIMVENPDGSFSHSLAYPERLIGADGEVEGAVNLLFDITERKKAVQKLRQANLVLENSPAVLFRWKAEPGWPVDMVSQNVSFFGYTQEELLSGRVPFAELVHPEDLDRVAAEVAEYTLRGDDRFQQEYRIVARDGEVHWIDDRTVVERDVAGRVTHYQGIVLDITERKRTELVMATRMRLLQYAATHTKDELLEATLNEAEELTGSKIGFYHFVAEDQQALSLMNWSTRTKTEFCKMQGKGLHYPVSEAGVWVDCIRQRRPVIHEDYAALPHCKGLPPGHAPVVRELVVPVFRGEKIVAVLGVGNKRQTYTQQDVEMVSLLADLAWEIAERKQAEEALEKRLVALTRPLDDAAGITFEELFNQADIQRLQDDFAQATGVASLITLPDGTPLTEPSNFSRLCDMIRSTEKGTANCMKSDAALGRTSASGPTIQKCLSGGLWGAGAAISVGGRHIANWLIGQVRDETITEEQMRAYARQVDADEEAVLEAFLEVPIMSREQFEQVARALYTLAQQLSSIAYQNVQQARFITDYKRAEEALRNSECKYRSIVDNAPFGISRSSKDGKLLSANPALASILKYDSAEELMETINLSSLQDVLFLKPSEREPLVKDILASDSWYVFNNRLRCKDGSFVTCRVHSRRIVDENGQVGEFESYQENITDQLEAELALQESEEKFRVLAETSPVAICLYQGEYLTYANPAMVRLFGYSIEELSRRKLWEWVHEDDQELVRSRARARLAGADVPNQYEAKFLSKSSEELHVMISAGTMEYQGRSTGVASFLDITERKKTEELIRSSLEEKEVLLREIHHRVKNNLQVISSLLYLQSHKFSDPELQSCFLESQSRICSMALAHEQLYQSKNLAEVSIKSYLENLVQKQQEIFVAPEQEVDCWLVVEDIPLDIEKVVPCGLLVTELLSNVYKHAFSDGRSGQVKISLESCAGQLELMVADDGVGLPAGFDYRQAKTLGLQLVSALVNQLGGTLEVVNGNGACFRVQFAG